MRTHSGLIGEHGVSRMIHRVINAKGLPEPVIEGVWRISWIDWVFGKSENLPQAFGDGG